MSKKYSIVVTKNKIVVSCGNGDNYSRLEIAPECILLEVGNNQTKSIIKMHDNEIDLLGDDIKFQANNIYITANYGDFNNKSIVWGDLLGFQSQNILFAASEHLKIKASQIDIK